MKPLYILIVLLGEITQAVALSGISTIHQDVGVKTALIGHSMTLKCKFKSTTVNFLSWYKQSLGGKPDVISTRMKLSKEATISPGYKDRFEVVAEDEKSTDLLIIKDIKKSDSATYYCGVLEFNAIEFGEGVFLHVRSSSSNTTAVIRQPALEPLRMGDSVNLSCSVYSEPCAEEQSFYWFRHGAAQPAVMYRSANECNPDPNMSSNKNCTLTLTLTSVSSSDAGMYYCALASCGEIVFGNGTKVQIKDLTEANHLLISCLSAALAVSFIVLLVLAFIMYKLQIEPCSDGEGAVSYLSGSSAPDALSQDAGSLHYAALSVNRSSKRHRPEESTKTECVYSRLKSIRE